jgi:hypothetical protein
VIQEWNLISRYGKDGCKPIASIRTANETGFSSVDENYSPYAAEAGCDFHRAVGAVVVSPALQRGKKANNNLGAP